VGRRTSFAHDTIPPSRPCTTIASPVAFSDPATNNHIPHDGRYDALSLMEQPHQANVASLDRLYLPVSRRLDR
jgi:hypothetical protein